MNLQSGCTSAEVFFQSWINIKSPVNISLFQKIFLGRIKGTVQREFNPEDLLLTGKSDVKISVDLEYEMRINEKIKNINKEIIRKQVVQSIMIHELLHVENSDLITLSKNYKKRKKKKIHVADFELEIFERYNKLREKTGLPKIKKMEELKYAVNKITSEL